MTAPLAGIRVVEIASFVAAPAAGALLADLGAEVVKVEVPRGEIYRYSTPRTGGIKSDFPEAPHFQMDNRGKRSLTLDVTREPARAALLRVISGADVVLTNMLPERQQKYGIDGESLRAERPELIFASMSGYGPAGSESNQPAFDYTAYWARTGFMNTMRDEGVPPSFLRPGVGDHAAALAIVTGILAALRVREQTGEGQVVDVSLLHTSFYVQGNDAANTLATGKAPPNHDRQRPRNPLWNHYETADGRWIFLVMIESDRYWPELCRALGLDELIAEERFTGPVNRYRNSEELTARLAGRIAEKSLEEWRPLLSARRLIWSPVQTLEEAIVDPVAQEAGVFQTIEHPTAGSFPTVSPPLRLSGFDLTSNRAAPLLGADSRSVLAEAGLTADEIDRALADE
jgi:crotonobetainyl-CoA:carnitine CoA-transferase CaiB-like acyl-CoA transferase